MKTSKHNQKKTTKHNQNVRTFSGIISTTKVGSDAQVKAARDLVSICPGIARFVDVQKHNVGRLHLRCGLDDFVGVVYGLERQLFGHAVIILKAYTMVNGIHCGRRC